MEPQRHGRITLSLASDVEVAVDTKSDEAADYSDFLVNISGVTLVGNTFSQDYLYGTMGDAVTLPYGTYAVSAQSCLPEDAEDGYGCGRFAGVCEDVEVMSPSETTAVTVECHMANGKVSVTFDESFLEDFSDAVIDLSVSSSRTVSLASDDTAGTEVYFNVGEEGSDLKYTIYGTIGKGSEDQKRLSYSNVMKLAPAQWAKITIKSNHNGIIGPDISVDDSLDNNGFTEVIDPNEGDGNVESEVTLPSIVVDTRIDPVTVVDCIIDVLE